MATDDEINRAILHIIDSHPDKVEQVQFEPRLLGWFLGQVMKAVNGAADPEFVTKRLKIYLMLSEDYGR